VYTGKTLRFNDVLCTLAESYARRSGTLTEADIELVSKQLGGQRKKRVKALRDRRGLVYTTAHYYAAQTIVTFLRNAAIVKNPQGACAREAVYVDGSHEMEDNALDFDDDGDDDEGDKYGEGDGDGDGVGVELIAHNNGHHDDPEGLDQEDKPEAPNSNADTETTLVITKEQAI